MYYKNSDYTVRIDVIDGCERYFIKFHSQANEPELEIQQDIFNLYSKDFSKPMERQRNEKRRHIEDGEIDGFIKSGKLTLDLDKFETQYAIETAIKTCTPTQQSRFTLHYIHGYSFSEIARMEKCHESSVRESITSALKKIKSFFRATPESTLFLTYIVKGIIITPHCSLTIEYTVFRYTILCGFKRASGIKNGAVTLSHVISIFPQ